MNIWKISIQNLKHKPIYTLLSVFILATSIALLVGVSQLDSSLKNQLNNNLGEIDMVIGAKGSPLQLVLSSVLHLDQPTGNILYKDAKRITRNPLIKSAVPISYGDNYKGYRIVGTNEKFANLYHTEINEGKAPSKPMEVILGALVAEHLKLKIGDTIKSSHGLVNDGIETHEDPLIVVGIYTTSHKVIDRLIVTPLETIWDVHHEEEEEEESGTKVEHHEGEHHEEDKEITSMLVTFRTPMGLLNTPRTINENTTLQAALPKYELERLYKFTGIGVQTITWISYAILLISCFTIFINLYRLVKDHAFDLALMRTYGANYFDLVKMILYQSLMTVLLSLLVGGFMCFVGLQMISSIMASFYQQNIQFQIFNTELLQQISLIIGIVLFAVSFSIYPIFKINISKTLSNEK